MGKFAGICAAVLLLVGAVAGVSAWTASAGIDLEVGDVAPDFELAASDGSTYRLSEFRDKQAVVIAWYPKAFTGGCTIECKSIAEKGDLIRAFDVKYFMASVDAVADNKGFAEQQRADFPLLSDPTKDAAKSYGVLNLFRVASRWTFYIGKDGKILGIDKEVKPPTSAEDMIAKLTEYHVEPAK